MDYSERCTKIIRSIEKAIDRGYTRFVIYPFGVNGILTKNILNWRFGIKEEFIIDENVCKINKEIRSIEYLSEVDIDEVCILINSENPEYYNELRERIMTYVPERNIEDIFPGCYELVPEFMSYAPWRIDKFFVECYKLVQNNTLCDIYRLYTLWSMVGQTLKLADGIVLEIGSWRGGSGCLIAAKASACPEIDTYLCDTFVGVVKAGEYDGVYVGGEHADTDKDIVLSLVDRMKLKNIHVLQGIFPDDTGKYVDEKAIRFCHIDVDVYQSGKEVFQYVWPRLVQGGVIVFDDYGALSCSGIHKLVNELKQDQNKIIMINLTGQAVIIKR